MFAGSKECIREGVWLLFVFAGSKKCTRNNVGCSLCLRVQKNVPAIGLVTLCVRGFKKMYPRCRCSYDYVCGFKKMHPQCQWSYSCVYGLKKIHPRRCLLLLVSAGSKNVPAIVFVAPRVCRFKKIHPWCRCSYGCVYGFIKMHPQQCWLLFEFVGSKKYTRNSVGYSLRLRVQKNVPTIVFDCSSCLWVQKNIPADRVEWLCVKCCYDMLLAA